jgi:hypothetical protein
MGLNHELAIPRLTVHATERMSTRKLTCGDVLAALSFGREVHTRGITIFVVGRKEVRKALDASLDISRFEGVHVLCSREGEIVTTYRNFDLRGLRPSRKTRSDRYLRTRAVAQAAAEIAQLNGGNDGR